ncbi:MAG: type II toxin-antitoxin system PemK/MazF family toxin, partial [Promethearchaeota archaeon]
MKPGNNTEAAPNLKSGDVILVTVQFTDTFETKIRPAVILFKEFDNIIIAGITSNQQMKGIPLSVDEGAIKPSIIKLNYIFTVSSIMIKRKLFSLNTEK